MLDAARALAFVNTRLDRPGGLVDALAEPEAATRWVADQLGARVPALTSTEHARLLALRDAARRLIAARSAGQPPRADDLDALNRASAAAPRADRLAGDWRAATTFADSGRSDPGDLPELLSALAGATIALAADAEADIAQCAADDCVVLFVRSDPRRRWHSDRCGNRMRAARSYARRREGP